MSKILSIVLAADLRRLNRDLREAQQDMNRFQRGISGLERSMSSALAPALMGAAAAAGYLAVTLGVDGVKAAVDDEAAAAKLATTMENLGLAQDTAAAEAQIDAMQRQLGIADELLRPSFEKLVRVFGDTSEALDMLSLATDIAAGTSRSLDQVTQALARAAGGSATALAKIVPELDKGILKTGNMDVITKELSRTFSGQAQTASESYKGQLDRLSVGFSELQESFGSGFLSALGNAEGKTGDLMQTMSDLEPAMSEVGAAVGDLTVELADMVVAANKAATAGKRFRDDPNWDDLGTLISEAAASNKYLIGTMIQGMPFIGPYASLLYQVAGGYDGITGAANAATGGITRTAMAMGLLTPSVDKNAAATSRWNAIAEANGASIKTTGGNLAEWLEGLKDVPTGTGSAAKETDILTDSFERQSIALEKDQKELQGYLNALEKANSDVATYAAGITQSILGNIDLGQAQTTGTELGIGTLDAFQRQIDQAQWFGNVLQSVKASGADQKLIDELASLGPEVGGKLAQEMIDKGLIQTFSDKIVDITNAAKLMGEAMVPEMLLAGQAEAVANVDGMIEGFAKESDRLKKLGKAIGKPIGSNIKSEILKAAAEALEIAEANQKASEARRAATQATQQANASGQQIVQLLAQVINTSNARTGYSMGVPIPSPVLG